MKKIFVLGKNRSGTKWLSNIILNNKKISGIRSDYHRGIVETNLFDVFNKIFGNLKRIDNYIAFVEVFTATDFFKLTGLSKDLLYEQRFYDYLDVFEFVMKKYAEKKDKDCWLQKAHIINFFNLYKRFPDAYFIVIERSLIDNIRSAIAYQRKIGIKGSVVREVFLYVLSKKIRKKVQKRENVFVIYYNDLKNKDYQKIKKLFDFIGVSFSKDFLKVNYKKNTSFKSEREKSKFGLLFKMKVNILYLILYSLPLFILTTFYYSYLKCFGKTSVIGGTFSMISDYYNLEKIEY